MSEKNYIERYWRDAKPEDAIKDPPMVARFGNGKDMSSVSQLCGCRKASNGQNIWYATGGCLYTHCQVYDAPDPGEGWRLIDIDKDSYKQDGIEYRERWQSTWNKRDELSWTPFSPKTFYRIRTTPTVTYVPFTWEDREQLRGRWIYRNGFPENEFLVATISRGSNGMLYAHGIGSERLCAEYAFIDTGKPVGKEVTQ